MKKGFTLVELLAVIVILGIIAAITMPIVDNVLKNSRQKAYDEQVNFILKQAEAWAATHDNRIQSDNEITLDTLINDGYIDQDSLKDPRTKKNMDGCVIVSYDDFYNEYTFEYGACIPK